jgi:5-methylcytosine-specific restriction endonuclease McrA
MLNSAVLVLNRHYQPIHVTTVKRAFVLLYQGMARAVDRRFQTFDFPSWAALSASVHDETIGTVDRRIRVPRVILLHACNQFPRSRVRFSRLNIYLRDGNACQYCGRGRGRVELNLDHVIPRSRGGMTTWENVVCSCIPCNVKKGGRTPEEAGMRLRRVPGRPRWSPLIQRAVGPGIHEAWRPFLTEADAAYWNTELEP